MDRLRIQGHDEVYRVPCGSTVAFVAIHRRIHDRAFGGIRIRPYASEADALDDALRLAQAMTRKVVSAGIDAGGAKTVLIAPRSGRDAAVAALGSFIESLGGTYHAGPDLGFGADDEAALRQTTSHLACTTGMGAATARTVEIAMRAVIDPERVAIQGLGAVGAPLAASLHDAGVSVEAADPRGVPAPLEAVAPPAIVAARADVFSPCALGGVLDARTIPQLGCPVVRGGANNPLADPHEDAWRCHARGILYVPDFLANAGAVIEGASRALDEADLIEGRMDAVADRVRDVVARARSERVPPLEVAVRDADARILGA